MYGMLKDYSEDDIYLDELVTYWKNILGNTFKIFRVNVNHGSLFSSISRCYNQELTKLEVDELKNEIRSFDLIELIKETIKIYSLQFL